MQGGRDGPGQWDKKPHDLLQHRPERISAVDNIASTLSELNFQPKENQQQQQKRKTPTTVQLMRQCGRGGRHGGEGGALTNGSCAPFCVNLFHSKPRVQHFFFFIPRLRLSATVTWYHMIYREIIAAFQVSTATQRNATQACSTGHKEGLTTRRKKIRN